MSDAATLDRCHIEVIGVRLAYEDLGDGPVILFIDGFDDVARCSTARCGSADRRRGAERERCIGTGGWNICR